MSAQSRNVRLLRSHTHVRSFAAEVSLCAPAQSSVNRAALTLRPATNGRWTWCSGITFRLRVRTRGTGYG